MDSPVLINKFIIKVSGIVSAYAVGVVDELVDRLSVRSNHLDQENHCTQFQIVHGIFLKCPLPSVVEVSPWTS